MTDKCKDCCVTCPMATMAHQIALGRMYATKELVALQKKVENGELVEVVRCKKCIYRERCEMEDMLLVECEDPYCPLGERDTDG